MDNLFKNFKPPLGMRNRHMQSLLNSSSLRRRRIMRSSAALQNRAKVFTLDGGSGHQAAGAVFKTGIKKPGSGRAAAWLGGECELKLHPGQLGPPLPAGFDVFRLNFRDHGDTHHLNPGIFHSCRLDEVSMRSGICRTGWRPGPWFLAGYSLGGNFSLRVALNAERAGLNLAQVVAVCPVINPANAMSAMEQGPAIL